jgi:hypothetical protein
MSSIIGLSHIVFTVNRIRNSEAKNSVFLKKFYSDGQKFEFDHSNVRNSLIRNKENAISCLSLFKPISYNLPAIELLFVNGTKARPFEKYGIIDASKAVNNEEKLQTYYFPNSDFFIRYYYDSFLESWIALDTNFFENGLGCWICTSDFESQKMFFSSIKNGKVLFENDYYFIIRCGVVNKTFSQFTFILVNDQSNSNYYNDDTGLSTLGWFTKDIEYESFNNKGLTLSESFSINLNVNIFNAMFLYNNRSISHELLKLN